MSRLSIDEGHLLCAINNPGDIGGPEDRAFLNRKTGRIAFLSRSYADAEAWYGRAVADDQLRDRAAMDQHPEEWVEIPKYHGPFFDDDGREEFVREFLAGIDAVLA